MHVSRLRAAVALNLTSNTDFITDFYDCDIRTKKRYEVSFSLGGSHTDLGTQSKHIEKNINDRA